MVGREGSLLPRSQGKQGEGRRSVAKGPEMNYLGFVENPCWKRKKEGMMDSI